MLISICIPVYNGATTIGELVNRVKQELSGYELEFVLVNDGSRDSSEEVCWALAEQDPCVRFLSLRRNFGEHNAVMCALNHCRGDYAVIIDDDFQNPPAEIVKLIQEADKGFDVVYARYLKKKHNLFRNLGSRFNDLMATWLLGKPKDLYLCSFKLIRREIAQEIVKYQGPFPYIDGLILRVTGSLSAVVVQHRERRQGKSGYTLAKLVNLWLNMFINFSVKPLRIVTFFGLLTAVFCLALAAVFVVERLVSPQPQFPGWASIIVAVLFIGSVQMVSLGVIGEYLGKQYLDTNGTPQWIIKKSKNV